MLNFENIGDLVEFMFENLDENNTTVSVVIDKDSTIEIMKELLSYEDVILDFCDIDTFDYEREYLVSLVYDENIDNHWHVSIDQVYNYEKEQYFGIGGYVLFHEDVNSKALVDMQNNEYVPLSKYDWFVIGESEDMEPDNGSENASGEKSDDSDNNCYTITVKCNLDSDEAMKVLKEMETRINHMNNMFDEMNHFRRLLRW